MKKHLVSTLLMGAAGLAVMLICPPAQAQTVLGINFVGGGGPSFPQPTPMAAAETAGAIPQANWNNALGNAGIMMGPLHDQNGVAIFGTSVTWGSNNNWTSGVAAVPNDFNMMAGYLDSTDHDTTVVIVEGINQFATGPYDVFVYFNGDTAGRYGFYMIVGNPPTKKGTDIALFGGAYIQDMGSGGNFLLFPGVMGDPLILLATAQNPSDPADNGFRAPVNGIQIFAP